MPDLTSLTPPMVIAALPSYLCWPVTTLANATGLDVPSATMLVLSHAAGWAGFGAGTQSTGGSWVHAPFNQIVAIPNGLVQHRVTSMLIDELDRLEADLRQKLRSPEYIRDQRTIAASYSFADRMRPLSTRERGCLTYLRDPDVRTLRQSREVADRDCLLIAFTRDELLRAHVGEKTSSSSADLVAELLPMLSHTDAKAIQPGRPARVEEPITAVRVSALVTTTPDILSKMVSASSPLLDAFLGKAVHWRALLRENPEVPLPQPNREKWRDEWACLQEASTEIRWGSHRAKDQTAASLAEFAAWESHIQKAATGWPEQIGWKLGWTADLPYKLFTVLQLGCMSPLDSTVACARMAIALGRWVAENAVDLQHDALAVETSQRAEDHADRLYRMIASRGTMTWRELLRTQRVQRKEVHQDAIESLISAGRLVITPEGDFRVVDEKNPTAPETDRRASA